ncbi:MAG: galactokinase [Anaerolineales bacterium]|nr:galactokinase [Anaerolineales bacterium]
MNRQARRTQMAAEFMRLYGGEPTLWTRAPGRVDLMGSHTDYNDGFILTMTIDRDTWIAARPRDDGRIRLHSLNVQGGGEFDLAQIEFNRRARWTNYMAGVVKIMQAAGYTVRGFDALVHTTVPVASGLSSSAALEMAAARLVEQLSGQTIDPVTLARLGQRAENQFVGVNCGILDQYTSAVGRAGCALLLDARHLTSQDIPLAAGLQVVIGDTRAPRNLAGTEYDERRTQCEEGVRLIRTVAPGVAALRDVSVAEFEQYVGLLPDLVARRCRFIVEENARVQAMAQALPAGDCAALHRLFADSYTGACELYELCVPSMDAMLAAMRSAPGFIAGRQARRLWRLPGGAGGGGADRRLCQPCGATLSAGDGGDAGHLRRLSHRRRKCS